MKLSVKIKAYFLRKITAKHSNHFDLHNASNVLFFRYDRIGDMILSTPVYRELKKTKPNIKILVLASKTNQGVLKDNPYIDDVFINNKNNFLSDLFLLLKLRKLKIDVCVEFDHSVVPHAILRLKIIKPKKIISVLKDGRYGVKGNELKMYDVFTKRNENMHFRDIWLETIKPLGVNPSSNHYDLFTSSKQEKIAANFLSKYSNKIKIGINLEGAVRGKKIKDGELENICKKLKNKCEGLQIILLSTPQNFKRVKQLQEKMNLKYVVQSYRTNTILDVSALIKYIDIVITPDTSISHVASTFNKPTITIHENNQHSYKLFAPTSNLNRTVFSKSTNSLNGFSLEQLLKYCFELIDSIKK